ncbi:uncharacterized protein LOC117652465 [Thrips palmi]|uniref:Uncharacterized protein LOC117652465 n=1 Tax=Thrips palmi TaxID=161013 RepID=A0A6P9ABD5_THRPL|nr:uncharacterized protein LOC117652465 [Thrips palmi]
MCVLCALVVLENATATETVLTNSATSIAEERFPCIAICPSHQIDRLAGMRILKQAVADANRTYSFMSGLNQEDWQIFAPNETSWPSGPGGPRDFILDEHLEKVLVDLHRLTDPGISSALPLFTETAHMLIGLNSLNLVDFMKRVFPSCHTFFHSCLWKGIPFDCCKHFKVRSTDLGFCYFFNNKEADRMVCMESFPENEEQRATCLGVHQRLSVFGPGSGLRMYLKTEKDPTTVADNAFLATLARVSVDRKCVATSVSMDATVYGVPGAAYVLALRVRRVKVDKRLAELRPAARKCLMSHEWPGATPRNRKNFPKAYSNLDCIVQCRRNYVLNACGCLVYPLSLGDPTSACVFSKIADCVANVSESFRFFRPPRASPGFSAQEQEKGLSCGDCLPNCDRTTFDIDFRTPDLAHVERFSDPVALLANRTLLDVFYPEPNAAERYTVAPAMPYGQILVSIGAMANLFLGISFLTLFEVLVTLVKCIWILFGEPRARK